MPYPIHLRGLGLRYLDADSAVRIVGALHDGNLESLSLLTIPITPPLIAEVLKMLVSKQIYFLSLDIPPTIKNDTAPLFEAMCNGETRISGLTMKSGDEDTHYLGQLDVIRSLASPTARHQLRDLVLNMPEVEGELPTIDGLPLGIWQALTIPSLNLLHVVAPATLTLAPSQLVLIESALRYRAEREYPPLVIRLHHCGDPFPEFGAYAFPMLESLAEEILPGSTVDVFEMVSL